MSFENLREDAHRIFRRHIDSNRHTPAWRWEMPIAEILAIPHTCEFAAKTGEQIRLREKSYAAKNYDDDDRFQRLLDRFEYAVEKGDSEHWSKT